MALARVDGDHVPVHAVRLAAVPVHTAARGQRAPHRRELCADRGDAHRLPERSGFDASSLALLATIAAFSLPLVIAQIIQYRSNDYLFVVSWPMLAPAAVAAVLAVSWMVWGVQEGDAFIYFQF